MEHDHQDAASKDVLAEGAMFMSLSLTLSHEVGSVVYREAAHHWNPFRGTGRDGILELQG